MSNWWLFIFFVDKICTFLTYFHKKQQKHKVLVNNFQLLFFRKAKYILGYYKTSIHCLNWPLNSYLTYRFMIFRVFFGSSMVGTKMAWGDHLNINISEFSLKFWKKYTKPQLFANLYDFCKNFIYLVHPTGYWCFQRWAKLVKLSFFFWKILTDLKSCLKILSIIVGSQCTISARKGVILAVKVEKLFFSRWSNFRVGQGDSPCTVEHTIAIFSNFFFAKDSQFKTLFFQGNPVKKFWL